MLSEWCVVSVYRQFLEPQFLRLWTVSAKGRVLLWKIDMKVFRWLRCISENGPWWRRTIDVCAPCFHFSDVGGRDLCTSADFVDLGIGWIAWPNFWMFSLFSPSLAVEVMFWGQKGCYVFVFLQMDRGVLSLLVAACWVPPLISPIHPGLWSGF